MKPLTKADQLKRNAPLKEKPYKSKEYLSWFHSLGLCCMVCGYRHIEAHHIKENSTDLKDDRYLLPLCSEHHKYSTELSPHGSPKKWRETYPIAKQRMIAEQYYNQYQKEKQV